MRNGKGDGRENVYCGTYGRGGKAVLALLGLGECGIREPRRPHIINEAALTVIVITQRNATLRISLQGERRGKKWSIRKERVGVWKREGLKFV